MRFNLPKGPCKNQFAQSLWWVTILKTPLRAQPDSITIVGPEQYLNAIDAVATEGLQKECDKNRYRCGFGFG